MFTGIVEEIGIIKSFVKLSNGAKLCINCSKVIKDSQIGDSICVNGVCQTLTEIYEDYFTVMLSDETLRITNFSVCKVGDKVNLERALTLKSRLGGHIVSGHIDCLAKLINIEKLSNFYNLEFEIPYEFSKYVVYKGSITLNGISLTVADINNNVFKVALIPHTYGNTNFKYLNVGDIVNAETDILSKYVEKLINFDNNKSNISLEFLKENGFV